MKFLIDREIDLFQETDLLNSKEYAETLVEAVKCAPTDTGFTIGVLGKWGSGKSSIIKSAAGKLDDGKTSAVKFVVYDAWKFNNDSFRRMFLLKLKDHLQIQTKKEMDAFFYSNTSTDLEVNPQPNYTFLSLTVLIFLTGFLLIWFLVDRTDLKINIALVVSFLGVLVNMAGKAYSDLKVSTTKPLLFAPEQFEECFDEFIWAAMKTNPDHTCKMKYVEKKCKRLCEQIVMVIDNIDRCDHSTAYELISSVKNFLGNKAGLVSIVPVDDEALKKHILSGYLDGKDAEEFMRKFFNVTMRIKPLKVYDLFDLANSINTTNKTRFNVNTIDIIGREYATNPRRIIQFFNDLMIEKYFFEQKYGEAFAKSEESLICKALLLRQEWPKFYEIVSKDTAKLNAPMVSIEEEIGKQEGLAGFLNVTQSIHELAEGVAIERVFSAHDRNMTAPQVVNDAIAKKDYDAIRDILSQKSNMADALLNRLLELIEKSIADKTFQTGVANYFDILCFVDSVEPLTTEFNSRLIDKARHSAREFIPFLTDYKRFTAYARRVSPVFGYWINSAAEIVNQEFGATGSKTPKVEKLVGLLSELIETNTNEKELMGLKAVADKELPRLEIPLLSLELTDAGYRKIVDETAISRTVDAIDSFTNVSKVDELLALSRLIAFTEPESTMIWQKIQQTTSSSPASYMDQLDLFYTYINNIFSRQEPITQNPAGLEAIQNVYSQILKTRVHNPNSGGSIIENMFLSGSFVHSVHMLMTLYKMSNETLDIEEALRQMFATNVEIVAEFVTICNELKQQYAFKFHTIKNIFFGSVAFSAESADIQRELLEATNDDEPLISDEQAARFIHHALYVVFEKPYERMPMLEPFLTIKRLESIFLHELLEKKAEQLAYLPTPFLLLFFGQLAKTKTLEHWDPKQLQLMLQRGNEEQRNAVLDEIIRRIDESGGSPILLDILEEANSIELLYMLRLQTVAQKIDDHELKSEMHTILQNKNPLNYAFPSELNIISAQYATGETHVVETVTRTLRSRIRDDRLHFTVGNDLVENSRDPHFLKPKTLTVEYSYKCKKAGLTIQEHEIFELPIPAHHMPTGSS